MFSALTVPSTCAEPQYRRGRQDRPVISTAAPLDLRSLLLALPRNPDASKIAEQCIVTQLKSWVTTLEQTRDADTSLGKPLGVDLEKLEGTSVSALGNSPASDAAAIVKAAAAGGVTDTKALWTWERLPYAVRCAGLSALKAGSTTEDERPKKKTRAVNDEQFVADLDEWYVLARIMWRSVQLTASRTKGFCATKRICVCCLALPR